MVVSGYTLMYEGSVDCVRAMGRLRRAGSHYCTVAINCMIPDKQQEIIAAASRQNAKVIYTSCDGGKLQRCIAARDACVQDFLGTDKDVLFWLDDDVIPPSGYDMVERLKKAMNDNECLMAAGFYQMMPGVGSLLAKEGRGYRPLRPELLHGKDVLVNATGFGCVAIKRQLLEQVPYRGAEYKTDDVDYCKDVIRSGHSIVGVTDVLCKHKRRT
jgi:hypothetical protein